MAPNTKPRLIDIDGTGLCLCSEGSSAQSLAWRDVVFVIAYKKDCFSFDQIRLELIAIHGDAIVITEHDAGFDGLREALAKHLPELEGWYERVFALPTFGTEVLTLMDRRKTTIY